MDVLEACDLSVSLLNIDILRDVSFALQRGRVLGLVGESGAGKSMLGRVIARNLPTSFRVRSGTLSFLGRDLVTIADEDRRKLLGERIAFIPQEPLTALNPVLTIGQQFDEHLKRLGVPQAIRRGRIIEALGSVRLREPEALIAHYPFQLSGGMCQRVLIAMAFASKPALIIADEPTTALDVSTQTHVVQIMRKMQRDHGTALLFITHDLRLAAHVCDDILVLYAGDIVERGPARAVTTTAQHPYTRALQAANPPLDGPINRLASLPEQMPGIEAFTMLPGCRFAPRCPMADDTCRRAIPALHELTSGHFVRCAKAGVVQDATPTAPMPVSIAARGSPVLILKNVTKHYPGERTWFTRRRSGTDAVKTIDLTVRAGEFVGIVGESGSGKSTVAKLIMGVEPISSGQITIDGEDVSVNNPAARRIRLGTLQMVFQDPQSALNPRRSVDRLITQVLEATRPAVSKTDRLMRARTLLHETGLSADLLERYPSQLSGGQKQRVNIARALCITPRLLVADEIVSGLDVSVQAQILNLLLDLRHERNIGLVFISHDLSVVRYLCSHVLVMRRGEVVEQGDAKAVLSQPQHPYTRSLIAAIPPEDPGRQWPRDTA
jgi:peptide/nickel transport system ATP-binding protein